MGKLKVPESPTTYTTHYEDLKGIDCYTPNTEISNNHAADMVNMYPEGGIPIKRRGWRKIQEFDSNIVTAYYDMYNDKSYVATEDSVAIKGGTFDAQVTKYVIPQKVTIDTNVSFKLDNFYATVSTPTPADGIVTLLVYVHFLEERDRDIWAEPISSSDISQYFAFDASDNIVISVEDFCSILDIDESNLRNYGAIQFKVTYMPTTPMVEITTQPVKHIIPFNGKIYFFSDMGIFTIENGAVSWVAETVPVTKFSLNPDGTGGQAYYSVNALTQDQKYLFHGDGSSQDFKPHGDGFNSPNVSYIFKVKKVEVFNGVTWETKALSTDYSVVQGSTDYDVLAADGTTTTLKTDWYVHFNSAPANWVSGDNVRITVEELDVELVENTTTRYGRYNRLRHKILNSDINIVHGSVDADRVFTVVDSNRIYYSESGDIAYFPDDGYIVAGSYAPIVGLHRKDDNLVAVTGESDTHAVYIIKSSTAVVTEQNFTGEGGFDNSSHEEQFFSVHPSASGKGALASKSFATLVDDPLYLGTQGIYSISSNYYTSQTMIINKSTFINPKLLAEPALKDAVACIWKHFYCLFVNNHVYLLDANDITRDEAGNKCYEGYYLENIPATGCVLPMGNEMYFANGKNWCKFNTDLEGHEAYYDDEVSIVGCSWEGKLDDDGYPQYFKNLSKKGVVVTVLAQDESSVNIYLSKDGDEYIQTAKMADMETDGITIDIYPLKKIKKYKRLRFRIENDEPEPFGLVKIVKTWSLGNYAK